MPPRRHFFLHKFPHLDDQKLRFPLSDHFGKVVDFWSVFEVFLVVSQRFEALHKEHNRLVFPDVAPVLHVCFQGDFYVLQKCWELVFYNVSAG